MGKRRTLLIVTACGGLAIALVVLLAHANEPRYNGRPLSNWVHAYYKYIRHQDSPEYTNAREAIRAIGTNAIPFLLKWIQQEPPSWQGTAYRKLPDFIKYTAPVSLIIDGPRYETAQAAMLAFHALGTNAVPAIPDLVTLMKGKTNHETVNRSIIAISYVGAPALPHMATALSDTNQTRRILIILKLREMAYHVGTNACLPPLRAALHDPDPMVRRSAAQELHELAPDLFTNTPSQ